MGRIEQLCTVLGAALGWCEKGAPGSGPQKEPAVEETRAHLYWVWDELEAQPEWLAQYTEASRLAAEALQL
eukprot:5790849-Lingulodinium_polyedra.AAC.1